MYKIPLTNSPNQTFVLNVPVDDENKRFGINLFYNEQGDFWSMTIFDPQTKNGIVSNIPLLSAFSKFSNILEQFSYLNIGSLYVVPMKEDKKSRPTKDNIGTDYIVVWGDTE